MRDKILTVGKLCLDLADRDAQSKSKKNRKLAIEGLSQKVLGKSQNLVWVLH